MRYIPAGPSISSIAAKLSCGVGRIRPDDLPRVDDELLAAVPLRGELVRGALEPRLAGRDDAVRRSGVVEVARHAKDATGLLRAELWQFRRHPENQVLDRGDRRRPRRTEHVEV